MKDVLKSAAAFVLVGLFFLLRIGGGVAGFIGGILCLGAVVDYFGIVATVVAVFLLPVTLAAIPLYDAFVYGNWLPFILIYGGGVAVGISNLS